MVEDLERMRKGKDSGYVQVCFLVDRETYEEMAAIREETGMPISQQVRLRFRGYTIRKVPTKHTDNGEKATIE